MNKLRCLDCGQLKSPNRPHICIHNETEKCKLCGRFKFKDHSCNFTSSISRNKGMKSYRDVVNYFLALDRSRNISLDKLSKQYGIDKSGIKNRIKTYLKNNIVSF